MTMLAQAADCVPLPLAASEKRARAHTAAIVALAVLARLAVLWSVVRHYPSNWLYGRGIELGLLAQSLVKGHGLADPFGPATGPTALLAPGYPWLVAAVFRTFGTLTPAAALAIMLLQLAFSALTVWLMMRLAERLFSPRAADLAGIFWALSLPLIWMPTIFWETCLSALLLTGSVWLALAYDRRPGRAMAAGIGAYCALAGLVNPALLPAMLGICGVAVWRQRRRARLAWLVALVTLTVTFAPWPLRNARIFHAFIPLRTTVGYELWMGNRPGGDGYLDDSLFPIFDKQELRAYIDQGELGFMRAKQEAARTYIREHPGSFAWLTARRAVRFWTGTGSKSGSVVFALHATLTALLGFAGLLKLARARRCWMALVFLVPIVLFPLPYYITHAEFRYRLVIDPLMTLLAAYALSSWRAATPGETDPSGTGLERAES
jgi:hypothetical protein